MAVPHRYAVRVVAAPMPARRGHLLFHDCDHHLQAGSDREGQQSLAHLVGELGQRHAHRVGHGGWLIVRLGDEVWPISTWKHRPAGPCTRKPSAVTAVSVHGGQNSQGRGQPDQQRMGHWALSNALAAQGVRVRIPSRGSLSPPILEEWI